MASIVTEFVGPRPGCYIMKFCQGATEIVTRFIALVLSVGVLIASAVSLGLIGDLPAFTDAQSRADIRNVTGGLNRETLLFNSLSAGGVGVGVAVLIIVWEIVMIILRFLNIGLLNIKSKIFLGIDIAVGLVLAVVVNISGILAAFMASEWSKVLRISTLQVSEVLSVTAVRNSQIALAVIAILDGLLIALLATWIIVFILRKWNEKVIKETAKDVI